MPHAAKPSTTKVGMGEEEFNDSICVEWAKVKAHMLRWKEELLIVQKEMQCIVAYHI